MRGRAVRLSPAAATITAPARVAASFAFNFGSAKKVICSAVACSREPTWLTRVPVSPATRPPRRVAICPGVSGPGIFLFRRRLALLLLDRLAVTADVLPAVQGCRRPLVALCLLAGLAVTP